MTNRTAIALRRGGHRQPLTCLRRHGRGRNRQPDPPGRVHSVVGETPVKPPTQGYVGGGGDTVSGLSVRSLVEVAREPPGGGAVA
jgi:hypothetical protein